MSYDSILGTPDVASAMVPDQTSTEIIKSAEQSSIIMSKAKKTPMSSKTYKQPVLASKAMAYWVNGETGLVQTSDLIWQNMTITAEPIGVIVPIPNDLIDDSNVPLWDEVKPEISEAFGMKIDSAALFGTDAPVSWPTGLVPAATAAGNVVTVGTNPTIAADVAALAGKVDSQGYAINGFAARPGISWTLRQAVDTTKRPIFADALTGNGEMSLYGYGLDEVRNGAWNSEAAELLAVDWSKIVVGVRRDITYDLYSEGVISDADGSVVLNLMQQRCKALLVTMRVGLAVAAPVTRIGGDVQKYPAGVLVPAGK